MFAHLCTCKVKYCVAIIMSGCTVQISPSTIGIAYTSQVPVILCAGRVCMYVQCVILFEGEN